MLDSKLIERLRSALVPRGTADIVPLHLEERFFSHSFITKCIDELEKMPIRAALGDTPTALEQLAYHLLCDSAYIGDDRR